MLDVLRDKLNDEIHILGEAQMPVGIDRQAARDEITHSRPFQGARDSLKAGEFHSGAIIDGFQSSPLRRHRAMIRPM